MPAVWIGSKYFKCVCNLAEATSTGCHAISRGIKLHCQIRVGTQLA